MKKVLGLAALAAALACGGAERKIVGQVDLEASRGSIGNRDHDRGPGRCCRGGGLSAGALVELPNTSPRADQAT